MHFKAVLAHLKSKIFSVGQPVANIFCIELCRTHIFVLGPPLRSPKNNKNKPFINKYKRDGINFPSQNDDSEKTEKNATIALYVLYAKKEKNISSLCFKI